MLYYILPYLNANIYHIYKVFPYLENFTRFFPRGGIISAKKQIGKKYIRETNPLRRYIPLYNNFLPKCAECAIHATLVAIHDHRSINAPKAQFIKNELAFAMNCRFRGINSRFAPRIGFRHCGLPLRAGYYIITPSAMPERAIHATLVAIHDHRSINAPKAQFIKNELAFAMNCRFRGINSRFAPRIGFRHCGLPLRAGYYIITSFRNAQNAQFMQL